MMVMRGGFDADAIESFRADEIGDVDQDQCPEILDGWGKPIGFIRWPTGYTLPPQIPDVNTNPDPFDPMRVSSGQADYGTTPLIFSGGAEGSLAVSVTGTAAKAPNYAGFAGSGDAVAGGWVSLLASGTIVPTPVPSTRQVTTGTLAPGAPLAASAVSASITNFDLLKK